jgi:hypothetical protein
MQRCNRRCESRNIPGWTVPTSASVLQVNKTVSGICHQTHPCCRMESPKKEQESSKLQEQAALFAQLPARTLTKHEAALFTRPQDYFRARDVCLQLWHARPQAFLTFTQCLKEAELRKVPESAILNAYIFLTRHAYVNAGFPSLAGVAGKVDEMVYTTFTALLDSNIAVR